MKLTRDDKTILLRALDDAYDFVNSLDDCMKGTLDLETIAANKRLMKSYRRLEKKIQQDLEKLATPRGGE